MIARITQTELLLSAEKKVRSEAKLNQKYCTIVETLKQLATQHPSARYVIAYIII